MFPPASVEMDLPLLNDRPTQPRIIWGLVDLFLADPKAFPLSSTEPFVVRSNLTGQSFVKGKCPEGNVVPPPFGGLFLNKTFGAHRHRSQNSRAGKGFASGSGCPGAGLVPSKGVKE